MLKNIVKKAFQFIFKQNYGLFPFNEKFSYLKLNNNNNKNQFSKIMRLDKSITIYNV